jgi:hypothetical protein
LLVKNPLTPILSPRRGSFAPLALWERGWG